MKHLSSFQEEADTILILQALDIAKIEKEVDIISPDTDFVLSTSMCLFLGKASRIPIGTSVLQRKVDNRPYMRQ